MHREEEEKKRKDKFIFLVDTRTHTSHRLCTHRLCLLDQLLFISNAYVCLSISFVLFFLFLRAFQIIIEKKEEEEEKKEKRL